MSGVKFIIFGCGNTGRKILDYIGSERVLFYCDNDETHTGKSINGIPVISFEELISIKKENDDYVVFVGINVSRYKVAVEKQLLACGITDFIGMEVLGKNYRREIFEYIDDELYEWISKKNNRYEYVISRLMDEVKELDYLKKHVNVFTMKPATGLLRERQLSLTVFCRKLQESIYEKCEVTMWMDYGALLGQRRHQGFIPWDDDMDFGIMRSDFRRMYQYYKENSGLFFPKTIYGDEYGAIGFLEKSEQENILEVTPYLYRIYGYDEKGIVRNAEIFIYDYFDDSISLDDYMGLIEYARKIIDINKGIPRIIEDMDSYIDACALISFESTAVIMPGIDYILQGVSGGFLLKSNDVFPLQEQLFEGEKFLFPQNIERILEFEYGDWKSLPDDIGINHAGIIEEL